MRCCNVIITYNIWQIQHNNPLKSIGCGSTVRILFPLLLIPHRTMLVTLLKPIPGFSSTISQTCQPNCNGNSEKDDRNSLEKCQKIQMHHSQFQCRTPARSALQLLNHSRRWKLLWLLLARVIATWADRSFVRNTATMAISISSPHQDDNIHLLFCLTARQCIIISLLL